VVTSVVIILLVLCAGSCTACVVALHREESAIYTANLGDSGFRVVRAGKIVHRSQEQQHYFNTPFQLAVAPSDMQGLVLSDRSAVQLAAQLFASNCSAELVVSIM